MDKFEDLHVEGDWVIKGDRLREQLEWSVKNRHAACYFQRWDYDGKTVVTVIDLYDDRYPTPTVTNDAEYVVARAFAQYGDVPIVYKDSTGVWDELRHREGHFATFRSLNASTSGEAIKLVLALHEQDASQQERPS